MRCSALVCMAILMAVIAGCSPADAPIPDFTASASPTDGPIHDFTWSPSPTGTPIPDFTLSAVLQGDWSVETKGAGEGWTRLGALAIDGNSYRFYPAPGVEIPSWMRDRFCFFERTTGEIVFEYEPGVSPNDDVRAFEDHDILLTCAGIGCEETFLIRVDQDGRELYLHSQVSEIQLYRIHKSYDD